LKHLPQLVTRQRGGRIRAIDDDHDPVLVRMRIQGHHWKRQKHGSEEG
jgi:hypothetical protein